MTLAADAGGRTWITLKDLLLACVLQALIVPLLPVVVAAPGSGYHVPNDFDVVYVSHVDSDGVLLSRDIQHDRLKRSLHRNHRLHLNISGKNQQFQLELISNKKLLAPGFKVYHRNSSSVNFTYSSLGLEATVLSDFHQSAECVYTGHGMAPSSQLDVAITLCDGMRGLIRTPSEDYVIEPMPLHLAYAHMPHELNPHIMYKRSSLNRQHTKYFESKNYNSGSTKWQPFSDQYSGHHRRKRTSRRRVYSRLESTVETLVVVDKDMYRNHGKENITTYVLSMFNIVSQLFNDNSIGSEVNIVLTGLILLEADEPGLHVQHHADQTLNSFCQWQSALSSADGRHHDHAILLTGLDICSYKDAPCDTLGFAPIKGMCNRLRSCTVNEDTGLSTAFTISHEIGHNLGMFHDGEGNYCRQIAGNIMSPTLTGQNGVFRWSSCSRIYLTKFLSTLQADCLGDRPNYVSELKFPDRLPGEIYNADIQCQWQFDSRARVCKYDFGSDPCHSLWCHNGGQLCETKFLPAAEGTSCGKGMWCRHGDCVRYGINGPSPIDGQWSRWTEWSVCSLTCDSGIKVRKRECNSPPPQYGGSLCRGVREHYKLCNIQACPERGPDLRSRQCTAYNNRKFRGGYYVWIPYRMIYDTEDQCKLFCQAKNYSFFFALSNQVEDGTRCNDYNNDVCILGVCKFVGCDLLVDSLAILDMCGVCKGDNSTCKLVHGQYTEQPAHNTYVQVAILPRGARSIYIKEKKHSQNYLAIRSVHGKYYLNGEWRLDWEGVLTFAGCRFTYRRPFDEPESLQCDGPLLEDVILEILVQGKNPGILYQYTLPKGMVEKPLQPADNYTWSIVVSECSQPCAGGRQVTSAHCLQNHKEEASTHLCDPLTKPKTGVFGCNTKPCQPRWEVKSWGLCSKTCGGGRQRRRVVCKQKRDSTTDRKVRRNQCKTSLKPETRQACNTQECPPSWHAGGYSQCSMSCGRGVKSREITCRSKTITGYSLLPDTMCKHQAKLRSSGKCQIRPCPRTKNYDWVISSWSQCPQSCGRRYRTRELQCSRRNKHGSIRIVHKKKCRHIAKPNIPLREACTASICEEKENRWTVSPWTECSLSCDGGIQMRSVQCVFGPDAVYSKNCSPKDKPFEKQLCHSQPCPSKETNCTDKLSWCNVFLKHDICRNNFYKVGCCKTCKGYPRR